MMGHSLWTGTAQQGCGTRTEPLLCDDLGELEGCLGVEDGDSVRTGRKSLLSRAALYNGSGRLQRAASTCMQLAQEKMLVLSGGRKKQPAVESSHTFAEAERQVGSAEWCGLQCTGADQTPTQLAAAQWAARNRSLAERSESASVTSAAETVRGLRDPEREREPISTIVHTLTAQDNVSGITVKYNITVEELLAVNRPATRASLLARKSIMIPIFADAQSRRDVLSLVDLESLPDDRREVHPGQAGPSLGKLTMLQEDVKADVQDPDPLRACCGSRGFVEGYDGNWEEQQEERGNVGESPGCAGERLTDVSLRLPSF